MKLFLALISMLFVLSACVTGYQPKNSGSYGYADEPIGPNRYLVTFAAKNSTPMIDVETYVLRRSQEVCSSKGFQTFQLLDRQTGKPMLSSKEMGESVQKSIDKKRSAIVMITCVNESENTQGTPAH